MAVVLLLVFFALGLPVAFALAGAGLVGIWLVTGDLKITMSMLGTTPLSVLSSYTLSTVPMFILMAYFSASSGLARDIYDAASDLLSSLRGGLGIATVFACGIFGAMSGASVAAASVMSTIAMPHMRRFGYSETLAAGAIGVGSTLDILIPPSVAMVIYGVLTGQSIGKLLIAGIVPGVVLGILLALTIYVWVTLFPASAPKTQRVSWSVRWRSLSRTWPSLSMIIIVIGLLYTGVATPTEIGAIGALIAALIGIVMGRLGWTGILDAIKKTISATAMIFMIIIGGSLFGYFITLSQVPQHMITAIGEMNLDRWLIIIGISVSYFVVSMFMDEIALTIITVQVTYPLVVALGFDPIWFGVLMMMLISMGMVFPPVGVAAFIVSASAKVNLITVYKGTSIMTIAIILTTVLMMFFPEIALWLPGRMH